MKINYIVPANIEEMADFADFNTTGATAFFESQIEAVHNDRAGDRTFDVCIITPKDPSEELPFPACFLGWDGHPFIFVVAREGDDIRHGLLATIANFDMLDAGDLVYHGIEAKEGTYRGVLFSEADAFNHCMPYIEKMMTGEMSHIEFAYRAMWTTPWALEAHRSADVYYTAKYAL